MTAPVRSSVAFVPGDNSPNHLQIAQKVGEGLSSNNEVIREQTNAALQAHLSFLRNAPAEQHAFALALAKQGGANKGLSEVSKKLLGPIRTLALREKKVVELLRNGAVKGANELILTTFREVNSAGESSPDGFDVDLHARSLIDAITVGLEGKPMPCSTASILEKPLLSVHNTLLRDGVDVAGEQRRNIESIGKLTTAPTAIGPKEAMRCPQK